MSRENEIKPKSESRKLLENIHIKVHALRMLPNHKPSQFEIDIARMISEKFKDECDECSEKANVYKYAPIQQVKKGFWEGMFGG